MRCVTRLIAGPLALAAAALVSPSAIAAVLLPVEVTTRSPAGSNNPAEGVVVDDLFLDGLVFPGADGAAPTVFASGDSFRAARDFDVLSGLENVNAEYGDRDTASDGDPTPFEKAGVAGQVCSVGGLQDCPDRAIQKPALEAVFSSLNLAEMTDGESGDFSYRVIFAAGLVDDDPGVDAVPEIVFVERGLNDRFAVELILEDAGGGMRFSDSLAISSEDFWQSPIRVDTNEINRAQPLGFGGFDLNAFGLSGGEIVLGFRLTGLEGGADLAGAFLTAADPDRFVPPMPPRVAVRTLEAGLTAVPLPGGLPLLLAGFGALFLKARRRG